MRLPFSLLSFAIFLAACSNSQSTDAVPDQFRFGVSYAAEPAANALVLCAAEVLANDVSHRLEILFPSQFDPAQLDLIIHFGPELSGFAHSAIIGSEDILLITHSSNSISEFGQSDIQAIFSGSHSSWAAVDGEDQAIQLWLPTESDESRRLLEEEVLLGSRVSSQALLASSPRHLQEMVAENIYALGILPGAWLESTLGSQILLSGVDVLVSSPQNFAGEVEAIAACLQSGSGRDALMEIYDG